MLARGRNLDVITQVSVAHAWLSLRDRLESTATAWYIGELADRSDRLPLERRDIDRHVGAQRPHRELEWAVVVELRPAFVEALAAEQGLGHSNHVA